MFRYSLTIFLSAFLLFWVQPLSARLLLPGFGGTAAVWTSCMMYFQIALLIGYLYTHALRNLLGPRTGWLLHCALLVVAGSCINLPLLSGSYPTENPILLEAWQLAAGVVGDLELSIAWQLTTAIGIPFLMLSATGPLIQAWHSTSHGNLDTYRLYAFSNAGCIASLVLFPFFFDPWLPLSVQTQVWSGSFWLFSVMIAVSGWQVGNRNSWTGQKEGSVVGTPGCSRSADRWRRRCDFLVWTILVAIASSLLLSATTVLCQEVASWPFLWILPLVSYLLALIVCFDRPAWYRRRLFFPALVMAIFLSIVLFHLGTHAGLGLQMAGSAGIVYCVSMVCHGELIRLKPEPSRLTGFYLAIALGGALGSVFAVVVAPKIFDHFFEFHLSLLACLVFCGAIVWREYFIQKKLSSKLVATHGLLTCMAISPILCSLMFESNPDFRPGTVFRGRNSCGIVTVKDAKGYRMMLSGQTNHGGQYLDSRAAQPSAYYSANSGADIAFALIRKRRRDSIESGSLAIGVIGLGSGSLASHGEPDDSFSFYEINPIVIQAAQEHFSYLMESMPVHIGDGRVLLARQLLSSGPQHFDLLFIDAFSSDSIPIHLLTSECFDLYLKHLADDGIIVAHITNQFVDLRPVLQGLGTAKKLHPVLIEHNNRDFGVAIRTRWVLLSRNKEIFDQEIARQVQVDWPPTHAPLPIWTDDFSSVAPLVSW